GAMTNLAMAIVKEPRIVAKIPRIVSMAGVYTRNRAEWNIRCDPVAAAIVLGCGAPMTLVGLDVTLQCQFSDADQERLYASPRPAARNLSAATRVWTERTRKLPVLHDPLAVETLLRPDLCETKNGIATVELEGRRTYAYSLFSPAAKGEAPRHAACVGVKSREALDLWLERVLAL
ncbi:MAG: nucleoside hydrolase, partial [Candidatus Sumerlaeota bacterium]|nr:nucleoside hydrolase [Candidatus Sumerlaeota bacterium]